MATITYLDEPLVVPRTERPKPADATLAPAPSHTSPHVYHKPFKKGRADLRSQHTLVIEIGFILALLVLIGVFRMPITGQETFEYTVQEQEVVQMEEILQTQQEQPPPPPPPAPRVVVAVSDDVLLEDIELDLDASLDIAEPLAEMPPPPPPPPPTEEEAEEVEDEIFMVVEEMPELIGGLESVQKWIKYPELAIKAGVEGRVFVQFIVDENGNVSQPQVVRGIGGGCDEAAMEAVMHAKFKPGRQRGKAVRVRYVIPIHFDLTQATK